MYTYTYLCMYMLYVYIYIFMYVYVHTHISVCTSIQHYELCLYSLIAIKKLPAHRFLFGLFSPFIFLFSLFFDNFKVTCMQLDTLTFVLLVLVHVVELTMQGATIAVRLVYACFISIFFVIFCFSGSDGARCNNCSGTCRQHFVESGWVGSSVSVFLYVYVCAYIYIFIYKYVRTYTYLFMYIYVFFCFSVGECISICLYDMYMYTFISISVYAYRYIWINIHKYIHLYTYIHIRVYLYMYIYICIHMIYFFYKCIYLIVHIYTDIHIVNLCM